MDRTLYRPQDGKQRKDRVPGGGQARLLLEHHDAERKSEQQAAHDDDQGIIELAADRTLRHRRQGQKKGRASDWRTWPGYR